MSSINRKGPIIDPGLCRCCGNMKKCRLLNVEYYWVDQKEIYSDMFMDTFGLLLSHLDGEAEERLICATCVSRLREASSFRLQVLACEEKLLKSNIHIHNEDGDMNGDEKYKSEVFIKEEREDGTNSTVPRVSGDDDHIDDVDDYLDCNDDVNNLEISSKPISKTSKGRKKRKSKETKRKGRKASVNEESLEKKRMLVKMKKMSEELRKMEHLDTMQDPSMESENKSKINNEHISHQNTITIVENSYVCPFDTSFSDYYCVYCRQIFIDPNKLREHTLTHDPTTFKEILNTKKTSLIDIYQINCRLCPKIINDIEIFKTHISNDHGKHIHETSNEFLKFRLTESNIACTECGMAFSFFHALKKHMAEHFGTCICDVCGAHYFEERMLVLHQKSHQRIDDKEFPCKDCGKSFKSKHSRYLHEAKMHKKEPAYPCSKCDEVLFSYTLRYRHMIEVHGEQRLFKCDHCERSYDSRKSLREHNRRFHLKIFKHQCDLCDKRFYLPSRLKEHMATHTGERNFRCDYCGKSYPRLRGLKVHLQSHSNEKKYRCVMCNASFTQNVNLKNHMKRQHQTLDAEEFHE